MGALGVLLSGWYGGQLVFEHGMRVKGRDILASVPEARLPGDAAIAHALERPACALESRSHAVEGPAHAVEGLAHARPGAGLHTEPPESAVP